MRSYERRRAIVSVAACAVWALGAALHAQQKVKPEDLSGTWQLNVAASTNPNGPAPAQGRAPGGGTRSGGAAGGGATGGGRGSGAAGGSATAPLTGPPPGGDLGPQELARMKAMLKAFQAAPVKLALLATAATVSITPDDQKPLAHTTDGKKLDVPVATKGFGSLSYKVKWDGASLKREIETIDTLHVTETYTLSADGKQLIMSVKSDCRMVRDVQLIEIKRVYDRVQ